MSCNYAARNRATDGGANRYLAWRDELAERLMRWFKRNRRADLEPEQVREFIDRNVALAGQLDPELRVRHTALTEELIEEKQWEAAAGFELSPEMVVTIAANAAIPILGLDPRVYRMVNSVILHPSTTTSHGLRAGPGASTVSDDEIAVIGLATPNAGPMTLSWDAALADSRDPAAGRNVTIHEFAHKIDMSDGYTDGVPPLRGTELDHWETVLADEYEHTKARRSDRVLRQYAWTNRAEFFAVATEAFFCYPPQLRAEKPELYGALVDFYRQDPAGRSQ